MTGVTRSGYLDTPSSRRLPIDHPRREQIIAAHCRAVESKIPTYRDPVTGLAVFTGEFLARRGACCSGGCRHCPYVDAT